MSDHRGKQRDGSLAFLGVHVVKQVGLKCVEFRQFIKSEVPLDLLLVNNSVGQRLLSHLAIINLLLHGALEMKVPLLFFLDNLIPGNLVCLQSNLEGGGGGISLPMFPTFKFHIMLQ